ncbi:Pc21g19020 [Rhizoctonia solani]|uniref:DNA polymerase delta subunit 3 n=1 Tax=Rhizoctonia solani TaxID=456999 RepID=A0A0K6G6K2_9AGAM|nr:Pc21g19020 [Rhizoctonia solani]
MASRAATDFLTKEVKVSNNIVTFRLLSRHLSIHVSEAKRELELYYEAAQRNKEPVFATYILTGAAAPQPHGGSSEQISRHLILLANEDELDAAKSKFVDVPSQHVYSLSPVALKDHGLLTSVADRVRQLDKQKGQAHAARMGMLLSEQAPWPRSGNGKPTPNTTISKDTSVTIAKKNEPVTKPKASGGDTPPPTKDGARQSALNFGSKKSAPESKLKENLPDKPKEKKTLIKPAALESVETEPASRKSTPQTERPKAVSKPPSTASSKSSIADSAKPVAASSRSIGPRSKRVLDSDEDEPTPNHSRLAIKRKKSRLAVEDNDDDDDEPSNIHDAAGLQAMMDIDDDNVVNGRSTREATPEHVPSTREAAAAAKAARIEASKGVDQKERKSHRRVPKGKKCVMKTRRVKNAKGYMVTEDYSSYEDADPNDTEKGEDTDEQSETDYGDDIDVDVSGKVVLTKPVKPAAKAPIAQPKRQQSSSLPNTKSKKGKSSDASKPGQQKLASFFGKK